MCAAEPAYLVRPHACAVAHAARVYHARVRGQQLLLQVVFKDHQDHLFAHSIGFEARQPRGTGFSMRVWQA